MVNGYTILTLHVLAVQRSVTVVRRSQAFHDAICEYRVLMIAIFSTVAYRTRTETGSRPRVHSTRGRQWLLQGYTQVGVPDTRYLSINLLRRARRNLYFDPPKLQAWRPSTYRRAHSSFVPVNIAAVAVTTQLYAPVVS